MTTSKWICTVAVLAVATSELPANAQWGSLFGASPSVEQISTTQLRRLQTAQEKAAKAAAQSGTQPPAAKFVIVDVRSPQEYRVSMIPGAITKQQYESHRQQYSDLTVIPYCTVGGRSTQYAAQLASKGVKVLNYKESILGWCAQNLPLVTPTGKATKTVHTASSRYRVPPTYKAVW